MTLSRAAISAFVVHCCFAFVVVFSFEDPQKWNDTSVSYWGSIVRKEELSPSQGSNLNRKALDVSITFSAPDARIATWEHGLGIDKPSMLSSVKVPDTLEKIKFAGPRVTLDSGDTVASRPPVFDLPVPTDIRLRYPKP
jgi:hypothetical protein